MELLKKYYDFERAYENFNHKFRDLGELDWIDSFDCVDKYILDIQNYFDHYKESIQSLGEAILEFTLKNFKEYIKDISFRKRDGLNYCIEVEWNNDEYYGLWITEDYIHNGNYYKLFSPESEGEFELYLRRYWFSCLTIEE